MSRLFNRVFTGVTSEKKLALDAEEMQALVDKAKNEEAAQVVNSCEGVLKARHIKAKSVLIISLL